MKKFDKSLTLQDVLDYLLDTIFFQKQYEIYIDGDFQYAWRDAALVSDASDILVIDSVENLGSHMSSCVPKEDVYQLNFWRRGELLSSKIEIRDLRTMIEIHRRRVAKHKKKKLPLILSLQGTTSGGFVPV